MKFTILSVLILFIALPSMAQLQLAPIAGLNISKFRTSENYSTEGFSYAYKNGFMGGLNAKYTPTNRFNVQVEGAFSQKGTEHTVDQMPGRTIIDINYLSLGIIGEYPFNDIISVNIGGSYGINIGEKFNEKDSPAGPLFDTKDYGAMGGLKFYIGKIFIRTNYYHGLNPVLSLLITDENGVPSKNEAHEYNQAFQVAVGYYFL